MYCGDLDGWMPQFNRSFLTCDRSFLTHDRSLLAEYGYGSLLGKRLTCAGWGAVTPSAGGHGHTPSPVYHPTPRGAPLGSMG